MLDQDPWIDFMWSKNNNKILIRGKHDLLSMILIYLMDKTILNTDERSKLFKDYIEISRKPKATVEQMFNSIIADFA